MELSELTSHIKEQVNLLDLFYKYDITVSRSKMALCFVHAEKSPSMRVYDTRYQCFGCGASGDVINFIQEIEGLSFFEAISWLNENFDLKLSGKMEMDESAKRKLRLKKIMWSIAEYCNETLLNNPSLTTERDFVRDKGMRADDVKKWMIGYCDVYLLHKEIGCTEQDLLDVGVYMKSAQDKTINLFSRRLMFPIFEPSGKVVSFGGRTLDPNEKSKYVNTPETVLYKKSQILYGYNHAKETIRKSKEVHVVEGYTDVIHLHQNGVTSAVASCGTALTHQHTEFLLNKTEKVFLMYDGDAAGRNSMLKTIMENKNHISKIGIKPLEDGEDPGSISPDQLNEIIALNPVEWGVEALNKGLAEMSDADKQLAYESSVNFLSEMAAASVLQSAGQRKLALMHDLPYSVVKKDSSGTVSQKPLVSKKTSNSPSQASVCLYAKREELGIPDDWFVSMGYQMDESIGSIEDIPVSKLLAFFNQVTISKLLEADITFEQRRELNIIKRDEEPSIEDFQEVLKLWREMDIILVPELESDFDI